jgi:hypothetical protein
VVSQLVVSTSRGHSTGNRVRSDARVRGWMHWVTAKALPELKCIMAWSQNAETVVGVRSFSNGSAVVT